MPVVTIFRPDGTKERRPLGYGGGLCHTATKPYEKRDVQGSMSTTPTPEAFQEPVVETTETTEQIKAK